MPATLEQLTREAVALSQDQRLTLAYRILSTLEPPPSAAIEEAWEREIAERIKRFKEGASETIPAEEVFAELDTFLQK